MSDNVVNMQGYTEPKIDNSEPPYEIFRAIIQDIMPLINSRLINAAEQLKSSDKFRFLANTVANTIYLNIITNAHDMIEISDEQKMSDVKRFTNSIMELYTAILKKREEQEGTH